MNLTCALVECGVEFQCRNARKYCGMACSALAHCAPSRKCQVCGKLLVRYQRVSCGPVCSAMMRAPGSGGGGHRAHTDATKAAGLRLWMVRPQLSAAVIGTMMRPQLSKNSVVGMAHRYGWPGRPSPIRRDGEHQLGERRRPVPAPSGTTLPALASAVAPVVAARKAPARPAAPPPKPVDPVPAPRAPWPVADDGGQRGGCQYIASHRKPFVFCGKACRPGSPYCQPHHDICFVHVRDRREDGYSAGTVAA